MVLLIQLCLHALLVVVVVVVLLLLLLLLVLVLVLLLLLVVLLVMMMMMMIMTMMAFSVGLTAEVARGPPCQAAAEHPPVCAQLK